MNHPAIRPVLGAACLASLSVAAMSAMETEQAIPDDLHIGVDLQSKQYDQGIVRNDDATVHEAASGRWLDIGLTIEMWQALGEDRTLPNNTNRGNVGQKADFPETTEFRARLDYLIEMKNVFQLLPFVEWINYPNLSAVPLKDGQWYLGLDAWWCTPLDGIELGGSFSYDPFYDVKYDSYSASGFLSHHLFRGSIGAREFAQFAPIDLSFWEMFDFGNENYNRMIGGGFNLYPNYNQDNWATGFNVFDLGAQAIMPMPWKDWWLTTRLEGHFWLNKYARDIISNQNQDTKEWVISVGLRWWPTSENRKD